MPERILVEVGAPTLAGIKTASLVNIPVSEEDPFEQKDLQELNRIFTAKGLRAIPLGITNGRILLYIYRPYALARDLKDELAQKLLKERGYELNSVGTAVMSLARNISVSINSESGEFPHEIGLFLGYPSEDVKGFIEHKNEGCKLVGTWKVYGDEKKAAEIFLRYQNCRQCYRRQLQCGKSIRDLTVATKVS